MKFKIKHLLIVTAIVALICLPARHLYLQTSGQQAQWPNAFEYPTSNFECLVRSFFFPSVVVFYVLVFLYSLKKMIESWFE